ncbi:hypothetical protein NEOLI_005438 [Neolecta irregularis DAH-3]|uniref:Uncharacterized protein n=1 Tax=Neolecta irregularis (strain DAH-3) TaxID=1198029 RepID=A0A1U7LKV7_NEOID|nr:hypothetical protein NEOLI_005438 [Neolecta irregularis DAH-3]|eukprot:OLL23284.1 hypothetical protein NEOLI_005438 [Neolecta irregularis DAH-3]
MSLFYILLTFAVAAYSIQDTFTLNPHYPTSKKWGNALGFAEDGSSVLSTSSNTPLSFEVKGPFLATSTDEVYFTKDVGELVATPYLDTQVPKTAFSLHHIPYTALIQLKAGNQSLFYDCGGSKGIYQQEKYAGNCTKVEFWAIVNGLTY